jgi:putative copper resistance protein D
MDAASRFGGRAGDQPTASRRVRRIVAGLVVAAVATPAGAGSAAAHGIAPADPPNLANLALGWSFEPAVVLPLLAVALAWLALVRRVDRAHPDRPVPRRRSAAFLGGLLTIAVALQSGIERYDTTLFSIHMVQHQLLTLVAPPLLVLGGPITLLLRAADHATRRRWILPLLHSRVARVIGHPLVGTLLFAGVMWGTHFSPLFDQALEHPLAHDIEHVAYLVAGVLFWFPAVGLDPGPYRLSHPVRILYTFLQMPQNTFLAVAITFAPAPLYAHYATLVRSWGPDPLADQQIAGGLMWVGGDLVFLAAILALVVAWSRREERDVGAAERRADAERAALREREAAFAARRPGGSGPAGQAEPADPSSRADHAKAAIRKR